MKTIQRFWNMVLIMAWIFTCQHIHAQDNRSMIVEKRLALVIGNANYSGANSLCFQNGACPPVNDALDIAKALRELKFEVIEGGTNVGLAQMEKLLGAFETKLSTGGYSVALFYFAGHGTGLESGNYLYPVDVPYPLSEVDVKYRCINVNHVLGKMNYPGVKTGIALLDACRDNPYERGWSRSTGEHGLREVDAPDGTFIGYATKPGSTAQNWSEGNRNGMFTNGILAHIHDAGSLHEFFPKVVAMVKAKTNGVQIPLMRSDLTPPVFGFGSQPTPVADDAIWVSNIEEFLNAIGNDRVIKMRSGMYDFGKYRKPISREFIKFEVSSTEDNEVEFFLQNIRNLSIIGVGDEPVRLETSFGSATVVTLQNCSNISLQNLVVGHSTLVTSCMANVITLLGRNDHVTIEGCKLFGSGQIGITEYLFDDRGIQWNEDIKVVNTDIFDCSLAAVSLDLGNYYFENCRIFNNKTEWSTIDAGGTARLRFVNCEIFDNESGVESLIAADDSAKIVLEKCNIFHNIPSTVTQSSWLFGDKASEIIQIDCKINTQR